MLRPGLRNIAIFPSDYRLDSAWALKPILIWMQLFGIPTDPFHFSSGFRFTAVHLVGITLMIWSEISLITVVVIEMGNEKETIKTYTEWWTFTLSSCVTCFTTTVMTTNLFIASCFQWKTLWRNVQEIEQNMGFNEAYCRSLRKTSYGAVALLVMVNFCQVLLLCCC